LTMLRVMPAARFPTFLDIVERHRYILQVAAIMQGTIDGGSFYVRGIRTLARKI
jgi:hypothetical protein